MADPQDGDAREDNLPPQVLDFVPGNEGPGAKVLPTLIRPGRSKRTNTNPSFLSYLRNTKACEKCIAKDRPSVKLL
jgi:hypothetical protein